MSRWPLPNPSPTGELPEILAVLAEAVRSCAGTTLVERNVAACRTCVVVVIYAVLRELAGLVNGVERRYFRHGRKYITSSDNRASNLALNFSIP